MRLFGIKEPIIGLYELDDSKPGQWYTLHGYFMKDIDGKTYIDDFAIFKTKVPKKQLNKL